MRAALMVFLGLPATANAHDFRPVELHIQQVDSSTFEINLHAEGSPATLRLPPHCASLPSESRFDCGSAGLVGHPIAFTGLRRRQVVVTAELIGRTLTLVSGPHEAALELPSEVSVSSALISHVRRVARRLAAPLGLIALFAALLLLKERRRAWPIFAATLVLATAVGALLPIHQSAAATICLLAVLYVCVEHRRPVRTTLPPLLLGLTLGLAIS